MVRKLVSVLLGLALVASVGAAQGAQEKATELTAGVLGFSYTTCSGCDGIFIASTGGAENGVFSGLGGASIGVGFYVSPGLSIEPTLSFSNLSSGGETITIVGIGAAVPVYFAKGWGRKGPYLAPRFAYNSISQSGSSSTSQMTAGVGLGTKVPLNAMAALRLQASFDLGFESSDVSSTTAFGALIGLSVFLK
jgi:hypothetical protein